MIIPKLNINTAFKEQVKKCMNNTFGPRNQYFIRATLPKHMTRVFELLMIYETRKYIKRNISNC